MSPHPLQVCHYTGLLKLVEKSGLGVAVKHQEKIYDHLGYNRTKNPVGKYDYVHLNSIFPDSVAVALLARLRGKPVLVHAHSTEEDFRSSFKGANLLAPLFRQWLKVVYGLADLLLTPTPYSQRLIRAYGVKRPIVPLSNGINIEVFHPDAEAGVRFRQRYGYTDEDFVVVSVGHLFERKGLDDFVKVAQALPETQFIWFGDTPESVLTDTIRTAIAAAPANLKFAGFVPSEAVRDAYCGADAFCFLSREETEGIVTLEALACGIPVIVRKIGVYEGWLEDGVSARILPGPPPQIPDQAVEALQTLKKHLGRSKDAENTRGKPVWADTRAAGLQVAKERAFPNIAARLEEITQDLMLWAGRGISATGAELNQNPKDTVADRGGNR